MPYSPKQRERNEALLAETIRLHETGLTPNEIATRMGVQAPAVRRRLKQAGKWGRTDVRDVLNGSKSGQARRQREAERRAEIAEEAVLLTRVDRTPCPWCEVRADIGCKHSGRKLVGGLGA